MVRHVKAPLAGSKAFAEQLAELEQRIADGLRSAVLTLADVAQAVRDRTAAKSEAIAHAGQLLKGSSRGIDTDLVVITARQAPVASDLRLVLALVQLAHIEGLIANQFELMRDQLTQIDPDVPDRHGTGERLSAMARSPPETER